MKRIDTPLKDCFILEPQVFEDERGYFYESFNQRTFNELCGQETHFVQDNQAKSNYGIIRGLHFQTGEYAQAKLVRVLQGKVLDVVVDLRPESPTYRQQYAIELSPENKLQLFVPRGFAHGYSVLEDDTVFFYKCDNFYQKSAEGGLYVFDEILAIDWKVSTHHAVLSDKDKVLPRLSEM
ncbi:MAG: dTDP-4-dehydrorhamnose 3,5-epimerase [Chitinophagaceae bacterium]|nr:dTDP-4-dehydrorhamnose 3,5-epimerase [Chitinophagaceae bacterium]